MRKSFLPFFVLSLAVAVSAQQIEADPATPSYNPTGSNLSGDLNVVGAVAMKKAMEIWTQEFNNRYPKVHFQLTLKGSSTAAAPLVTGISQIAPMGRELWDCELVQFKHTWGYLPLRVQVSRGSYNVSQRSQILAVYVNKDNPIKRLTLSQVDAIFSKSRLRGYKERIETWGQLGLTGELAQQPIHPYSLSEDSTGVAEWFRGRVLLNGKFRDAVDDVPSPQELMKRLEADRSAIGFTGISYLGPNVKVVPIAEDDAGPFSSGSLADVLSGKYPLTRFMYVYLKQPPGKPMDPVIKEFLTYVLSKQGQEAQARQGELLPLPAEVVRQERVQLEKFK
jgi:phosphate transport system substrate-binding protein